ncbi:MAG: hypothetical protein R3F14_17925 [Polyangiaceae bacterium]
MPILISGHEIHDDGEDHSDYEVDEALWVVTRDGVGRFEHHVCPLDFVVGLCGPNPVNALKARLCGQSPSIAGSDAGDPTLDCTELDGTYECLGQPAIMTSLKYKGIDSIYLGCFNND